MKSRDEILDIARDLAGRFAERAATHDADGTFPYQNYADLRAAGYPLISVPARFGGWGAGLLDCVMAQEALGMGDGSTALSVAMHVQTVGNAASENWPGPIFERFCQEVTQRGVLVNSCATEPELGSPSRGGRPKTTAIRQDSGDYVINGRKSFASMSPVLDYFIIPAGIDGSEDVARFLIPRSAGVSVEETWDSMGMRTTGSHDIVLKDVPATDAMILSRGPVRPPDPTRPIVNPWFTLCVSACYLGIAAAAQQSALRYALERVPTALGKPIATLESIQRRLGECEYELIAARTVLYQTADAWDKQPDRRAEMGEAMIVAKLMATNSAIRIVDSAMRAVGGESMTHRLPLERYYRDVRAGLFHPPFDDIALPLLGRIALQRNALPLSSNK